jgi:hypothetical protein
MQTKKLLVCSNRPRATVGLVACESNTPAAQTAPKMTNDDLDSGGDGQDQQRCDAGCLQA